MMEGEIFRTVQKSTIDSSRGLHNLEVAIGGELARTSLQPRPVGRSPGGQAARTSSNSQFGAAAAAESVVAAAGVVGADVSSESAKTF